MISVGKPVEYIKQKIRRPFGTVITTIGSGYYGGAGCSKSNEMTRHFENIVIHPGFL